MRTLISEPQPPDPDHHRRCAPPNVRGSQESGRRPGGTPPAHHHLRPGDRPARAAHADRDPSDVEVISMVMCSIHDDADIARHEVAQQIAFYSSVKSYETVLDVNGFAVEGRTTREAFDRRDFPAMFAAVSDKMIDTMGVAGTADQVRDGAHALRRRSRPHHAVLTIGRHRPRTRAGKPREPHPRMLAAEDCSSRTIAPMSSGASFVCR